MEKILSIITVCYNSEKTIERCINSIVSQMDDRIEYIIVDGNSKDHTIDIVKKYKQIKYISEKDNGIYDAMNKGIKMSTGKWIIFMNSDDCFINNKLLKLVDILKTNDNYDCIYSDIEEVYMLDKKEYTRIFKVTEDLSSLNKEMLIRHQSFLCKRQALLDIDCFDLKYKVAADWDSLIRLNNLGYRFKKIDYLFSRFYLGGASINNHVKERHLIRKNNNCYKLIDFKLYTDWFHSLNLRRKLTKLFYHEKVEEKWLEHNNFKIKKV